MSSQNRKHQFQSFDEYFVYQNNLFVDQFQTPKTNHKYQIHQRKISQVSTRSLKSKDKILPSVLNSFRTSKNKRFSDSIASTKPEKRNNEGSQITKRQRSKKVSKFPNKKQVSDKVKLKINTQRKRKSMFNESLTSRSIKCPQSAPGSIKKSSSSVKKLLSKNQPISSRKIENKSMMNRLKLRNKQNISTTIIQRCTKVMTEYVQRLNQLQNQNEVLKKENKMLRLFNCHDLFSKTEENCLD